jgi:hypothetical protein
MHTHINRHRQAHTQGVLYEVLQRKVVHCGVG